MAEVVAGVQLTAEEKQQALEQFARNHQLRTEQDLEAYRVAQLLTPAGFDEQIQLPFRLEKYCNAAFRAKAEARFLDRKTQLDRVVYSLLRLQDAGLARELYLRIEEGEANFADLAAVYAEGPEKATRGIVGPVPLTQAHPLLADRLRTATPGVVMEPFRIEAWWLVVRLEALTPATFDDDTALQMTQELFDRWLNEQVEREIASLRAQLVPGVEPESAP